MKNQRFIQWFKESYGVDAPRDYVEFLEENAKAVYNGRGGTLWISDDVMDETTDRDLHLKGLCLIGGGDSLTHYLLRAKDGKIIVVDRHDYSVVDAWFSGIDTMIGLMGFATA